MAHSHGVEIEEVSLGFGKEEQVFPRAREAVAHARGHVVGLVPDDPVPDNPASLGHRQSEPFRD
jgi:hypothetical protein